MEVKEGVSYYIFKLPTQKALANKLLKMAMQTNVTGLKAIQMIMEQLDGKPHQSIALETKHPTKIEIINKSGVELNDEGLPK